MCRTIRDAFDEFDRVLGVLSLRRAEDEQPPVPVEEIERLIDARHAARRRRDFAEADRIRDDLAARGVLLEDRAGGDTLETEVGSRRAISDVQARCLDALTMPLHHDTPLPGPKARRRSSRATRRWCRRHTRAAIRSSSSAAPARIVEDVDGNVFLDCAAGIAVNATGHSHPESSRRSPSRRAASSTCPAPTSTTSRRCAWPRRSPRSSPIDGGGRESFFGNSGTEAIEAAHQARALRDRPARTSSRSSAAFHGRTMGALALTASKAMQRRGLRADDARRLSRAVRRLLSLSARADSRRTAPPSAWTTSSIRSSCTWSRPTRSPAWSSSRSRAKAATSSRRTQFLQRLRELTSEHGMLLSSTKCSRGWAAPGRCSRSSTPASSPTSSRSRRASRPGCRSASPRRAPI